MKNFLKLMSLLMIGLFLFSRNMYAQDIVLPIKGINRLFVGLMLPLADPLIYQTEDAHFFDPKFVPNRNVGGISFYPDYFPGVFVSFMQNGRYQHSLGYRFAKNSGEDLFINGFDGQIDFQYEHSELVYSLDYIPFNLDRTNLSVSPFVGFNAHFSFLKYNSSRFTSALGYQSYLDLMDRYINATLQSALGIKFKYKNLLVELGASFNLISYLNTSESINSRSQYLSEPEMLNQNQHKESEFLKFKDIFDEHSGPNVLTFKVAYSIKSFGN